MAALLIGFVTSVGLLVPVLLGLIAMGGAAVLVALPHLAVAVIVFLSFTNASMVVADSLGFSNLTEALLLLALAIAALDFFHRRRVPAMVPYIAFAGIVYLASLATTALLAVDPFVSVEETLVATKRILVVVVLSAIVSNVQRFRWAIYGVIAGGAFLGLLTVIQSIFGLQDVDFLGFAQVAQAEIADQIDSWRYVGPVNDPNYYAQLLLLSLPLAFAGVLVAPTTRLRALFLIAVGIVLAAMLLTVSRGAVLSLLFVLAVALRRQRRRLLVATVFLLVIGAIGLNFVPDVVVNRFAGVYRDVVSALTGRGVVADKAIAGRLAEMEVAIRLFFEHPILGVGYNNYDGLYQDTARLHSLMSRGQGREAHSLYLEILAERGLIGFGFFAALVALSIWLANIGSRIMSAGGFRAEGAYAGALILSLVAYLATSFFLHEAFTSSFWMLIALAASAPQATLPPAMSRKKTGPRTYYVFHKVDDETSNEAARRRPDNGTNTVAPRKTQKSPPPASPFNIVATIRRHFFVILGAAVIAGGMGALAPMNSTPKYFAQGSLLFRFEREYFPDNVAYTEYRGESIRPLLEGAMQTELEILGSRDVVKDAVIRSDYAPDGDMIAERLPRFLKALSIRRVEGTQLVRVSFEDEDPDMAVRAIAALFDSFLDHRVALFDTEPELVLRAAVDETRARLDRLRLDFAQVERAIEEFGEVAPDAPAATVADGQADGLEDLSALQVRLEGLGTEIDLAEQRYELLVNLLSEEELAIRVAEAQGPAIKVLERPEADPQPTGLSNLAYGVIAGLIGLVIAALVALWTEWWKTNRARSARDT